VRPAPDSECVVCSGWIDVVACGACGIEGRAQGMTDNMRSGAVWGARVATLE
jgi:hypothetical protein